MGHRSAFYYDNLSNLTCVLDPDNGLTYYTYDATRRMTSVKNPWGEVTQYEYSPGGRLLKRLLGNGTIAYYSYDTVGQVRKVENVKSDLSVISSFEYERNALGSPVSILREDESVIYYEYDPKQQLTKETHVDPLGQQVYGWTWDYDLAGNRLHQTFNGVTTAYTYNAANELTQETTAGATTYFEYDHNGNTTAKIEPGATTQYRWDRENLMTQVDLPTGAHNYFGYDADGKRVEKRDGDGYTRFIYQGPDMLKLLQERDANDARQAQYTMANGLEAMRRGSTSSFYHYDWLGSTFELTNAAQTVTDTYLYNAWGEVLNQTGTTGNPHLYVGRERYYRALAAGLYLLGLRYYASAAGRFVSSDPLGHRRLREAEHSTSGGPFSSHVPARRRTARTGGQFGPAGLLQYPPVSLCAYAHNRPGLWTDATGLTPALLEKIRAHALRFIGNQCYEHYSLPDSWECIDVFVRAAINAGVDVEFGMMEDYINPFYERDYHNCRPGLFGESPNDPDLPYGLFHRRICNVAEWLRHTGVWEQPCVHPQEGMLVTLRTAPRSTAWLYEWIIGNDRHGTHSGVISRVENGRITCIIACSGSEGGRQRKVPQVASNVATGAYGADNIVGCGAPSQ